MIPTITFYNIIEIFCAGFAAGVAFAVYMHYKRRKK